jgi:hypothetical protein
MRTLTAGEKELMNATKRFFLNPAVDLSTELTANPWNTFDALIANPAAFGTIKPCLHKNMRRRNFKRVVNAATKFLQEQYDLKVVV